MPFGGALTIGLIGAGGSILGGLFGKSAAQKAAEQQAKSAQAALDFQKTVFAEQQQNQRPYQDAGVFSIGTLMNAIQNGQFGPGSLPNVPEFTAGKFTAPTLEEARSTPGYEFTQQQGMKGILQAAAAAGGSIGGGTIRAADTFNTGLADTTYSNVFNRALQGYGANLQGYQTQLQGYGAQLQKQGQEFGQLFAPAQLGEQAISSINNTGTQAAYNVGNLMTQQGNALAGGIVGGANAVTGGITGASNDVMQSLLLGKLFNPGKATPSGPASWAIPG